MFGNNPVRKQDLHPAGMLAVQEIFYTIQGEGPSAGRPAVFVRLAGCNLRCFFCDTDFESGMENMMSVSRIMDTIREACDNRDRKDRVLVVITGGEPLRQNIVQLVRVLEYATFEVEIETAGTLWVPGLEDTAVRIVCSPKTHNLNPEVYARAEAFKYVVRSGCTDTDGLPNLSTQQRGKNQTLAKPRPGAEVYLQPMDDGEDAADRCNLQHVVATALKHGYRVSLQQHKLLNVP